MEIWAFCQECDRWFYCARCPQAVDPNQVCPVCGSVPHTFADRGSTGAEAPDAGTPAPRGAATEKRRPVQG